MSISSSFQSPRVDIAKNSCTSVLLNSLILHSLSHTILLNIARIMSQNHQIDDVDDASASGLSRLHGYLPNMVRRRLPSISSRRRSQSSNVNSNAGIHQHFSAQHSRSQSHDLGYIPRPDSSASSSSYDSTMDRNYEPDPWSMLPGRQLSIAPPTERQSQLGWKFAYEGTALLARSVREATSPDHDPRLTRRLYVDGLAYLATGLPTDLTEREVAQLRDALPAINVVHADSSRERRTSNSCAPQHATMRRERKSITYVITSRLILCLVFLINLLLPYIQMLLRLAYCYERRLRISERLMAVGIDIGSKSRSQGLLSRTSLIFVPFRRFAVAQP